MTEKFLVSKCPAGHGCLPSALGSLLPGSQISRSCHRGAESCKSPGTSPATDIVQKQSPGIQGTEQACEHGSMSASWLVQRLEIGRPWKVLSQDMLVSNAVSGRCCLRGHCKRQNRSTCGSKKAAWGAQMPLLRRARSWKDMCLRCTALVMRHVCLWLCDCPYTLCDQSSVPRGLLAPSPKYTHTRGHVRGVRECLMWVIDCLDAARWVTDGWRWKDANTRQGRQAGLRPQPPPRLINPL